MARTVDIDSMDIENVQFEVSQVRTSAVCCTTNLTLEVINDFLTQVWQAEEKAATKYTQATHTLTLVHDLNTRFWGATQRLLGGDPTTQILQSPFTGLSYPEIRNLLAEINQTTGSTLTTDWFLVLDEHSAQTNSAVMVNVEPKGNAHALRSSVRSLRVDYPTSSLYLAAASIAHPSVDELKEIVDGNPEKYGGILRG